MNNGKISKQNIVSEDLNKPSKTAIIMAYWLAMALPLVAFRLVVIQFTDNEMYYYLPAVAWFIFWGYSMYKMVVGDADIVDN